MDEVLMWAHYSSGLRGLRFSIETDLLTDWPREIKKVQYTEKIVELDPAGFLTRDKRTITESLGAILSSKSKAWEYEQEYRWFIPTQMCPKAKDESDNWYVPINIKAVKRIDIGERCEPTERDEILQRIKELGLDIQIKQTTLDKTDYKLYYVNL